MGHAFTDHIPNMFANVVTGAPASVFYEMMYEDSWFDEAVENIARGYGADDDDDDFWDADELKILEGEDALALEKAIYQKGVEVRTNGQTQPTRTPYGPALEPGAVDALLDKYPGAEELDTSGLPYEGVGQLRGAELYRQTFWDEEFDLVDDLINQGTLDGIVEQTEQLVEDAGLMSDDDSWLMDALKGIGDVISKGIGISVFGDPDLSGNLSDIKKSVDDTLDWLEGTAQDVLETQYDNLVDQGLSQQVTSDTVLFGGVTPQTQSRVDDWGAKKDKNEVFRTLDDILEAEGLDAAADIINNPNNYFEVNPDGGYLDPQDVQAWTTTLDTDDQVVISNALSDMNTSTNQLQTDATARAAGAAEDETLADLAPPNWELDEGLVEQGTPGWFGEKMPEGRGFEGGGFTGLPYSGVEFAGPEGLGRTAEWQQQFDFFTTQGWGEDHAAYLASNWDALWGVESVFGTEREERKNWILGQMKGGLTGLEAEDAWGEWVAGGRGSVLPGDEGPLPGQPTGLSDGQRRTNPDGSVDRWDAATSAWIRVSGPTPTGGPKDEPTDGLEGRRFTDTESLWDAITEGGLQVTFKTTDTQGNTQTHDLWNWLEPQQGTGNTLRRFLNEAFNQGYQYDEESGGWLGADGNPADLAVSTGLWSQYGAGQAYTATGFGVEPSELKVDWSKQFTNVFNTMPGSSRFDVQRERDRLYGESRTLYELMEPWGSKGDLASAMWDNTRDVENRGRNTNERSLTGANAELSDQNYKAWASDYLYNPQAYRSSDEFYANVQGLRDDMQKYEKLTMNELLDFTLDADLLDADTTDPGYVDDIYSWMNFMDTEDPSHVNKIASLVSLYNATPDSDLWLRNDLFNLHSNLYQSALASGWTPQQYLRSFVKNPPVKEADKPFDIFDD